MHSEVLFFKYQKTWLQMLLVFTKHFRRDSILLE